MAELWLTRTPNGRLLLYQRQPRKVSRNKVWTMTGLSELKTPRYKYVRKVSENPEFIQGQVFRINEFPGSECVLSSKDNNAMVKAELYIPSPDEQLYNEFWVTSAYNYTEHCNNRVNFDKRFKFYSRSLAIFRALTVYRDSSL